MSALWLDLDATARPIVRHDGNTDAILSLLPARLKEARRAQGLSLDAVAKLSGVSRSMVSQIERGESSPTIATLWNLTRALQVDFAGLLEDDPSDQIEVLRNADVPSIENRGAGCTIRILSPPEDAGRHEVYELRFAQNGALDSQPHRRGAREHLTVIAGALTIISGGSSQTIEAGDTARYAADVATLYIFRATRAGIPGSSGRVISFKTDIFP